MTDSQDIVPAGAPMGRPLRMTREIEDAICQRIALGEGLVEICRDDDMPARSTVFAWLLDERSGDFSDRYARARELQADSLFDETKEIADDGSNDWMERHDKDGNSIGWQLNGEHVQRSKLRVEQRRWMAGKLRPKKYGDKLDLTSGGDKIVASADDVSAKAAALLALAAARKDGDAS